jgi:hypothetical protein
MGLCDALLTTGKGFDPGVSGSGLRREFILTTVGHLGDVDVVQSHSACPRRKQLMVIRARRLLLTNAGPDLDLDLDLLVVFTKSRGTASETLVYSIAKWAKHPYLFPHPPS